MRVSVELGGTGLRPLTRDLLSRLKFSSRRADRASLVRRLQACRQPDEYFDFALDGFPGGPSQNRAELLALVHEASDREPRVIVELGTEAGGTTFVLSHAISSVTTVVAVDLWVQNADRLRAFRRPGQELHVINGPSIAASTLEQVAGALGGREVDLLLIDADHTFAGVWGDFLAYRGFLHPGSLVVFHDIVADRRLLGDSPSASYVGEVPVLWQLIKAHYNHWEFVDDWAQDGRGIGVIEFEPAVPPAQILFARSP